MNTETTNTVPTSCEGSTENAPTLLAPQLPKPHRRPRHPHRSKITDLPPDIRTLINQSLYDHMPYPKLIALLAEKGHPGFTKCNFSRWVKSGYQHWLQQRERLESVRLKVDDVEKRINEIEETGMAQCNRLNSLLLSIQLTQAVQDFDPSLLLQRLAEKPSQFFKLARTINTQSVERQRQERLKIIREKLGTDQPLGGTERGHQAIKLALGLPDVLPASPASLPRIA